MSSCSSCEVKIIVNYTQECMCIGVYSIFSTRPVRVLKSIIFSSFSILFYLKSVVDMKISSESLLKQHNRKPYFIQQNKCEFFLFMSSYALLFCKTIALWYGTISIRKGRGLSSIPARCQYFIKHFLSLIYMN